MGELGIGASSNNLASNSSELLNSIREANDLSWADKCTKIIQKDI